MDIHIHPPQTHNRPPRSTTPIHIRLRRPPPRQNSVTIGQDGRSIQQRDPTILLRPIFVNAVEVGYAYGEALGQRGRLHALGCVLVAWHFISKGHDLKLFLPRCYKRFAEKTVGFDALRALDEAGLVQWTLGQGAEKYAELGRVLAANARRFGGCICGTSTMRRIYEENPVYRFVITRRLLVPTFLPNSIDVVFPVDGPEGRNGSPHQRTIISMDEDPDYQLASFQQLSLRHQARSLASLLQFLPNPQQHIRTLTQIEALAGFDRGFY
ncbi:RNase-Zc3h12a domain-containing protein [Aphelenchoides besseyi]|nr:RNase-Zc3h12a domain-containing protein [Aphelenchoides besseyi]KAI6211457.1 RNase-Zc3h12a domain-containing protein [Aphelenchoides besseyi]